MKQPRTETAEFYAGVLKDQESSGLAMSEFARSRGIVPNKLFWWRRRLRLLDARDRGEPELRRPRSGGAKLLPVRMVQSVPELGPLARTSGPYVLTLQSMSLALPEGFDVDRAVALIRGLISC